MKIYWHQDATSDMAQVARGLHESLYDAVDHKLGTDPTSLGKALRGTSPVIWSIRFNKYRIIYLIKSSEVWILGVVKREESYSGRLMSRYSKTAKFVMTMRRMQGVTH